MTQPCLLIYCPFFIPFHLPIIPLSNLSPMDSGNSASMQSSSTGDEEYDSRPDSIMAAFLANQPPPHGGPFAASSSAALAFDHFSPLFDPRSSLSNQTPLLHFDMPWTRAEPDLAGPPSNSASAAAASHSLSSISNFSAQVHNFPHHPSEGSTNSFRPTDQTELQNIPNNCGGGSGGGGGGLHPKKRPRASRRAPTTVLTTNTTNFRAMVQEFTGIPAPPFPASSSSPFMRNAARFDLFGNGRKATHLDVAPSAQSHLLRPFPQKESPSTATLLAGGNLQNPIFNINNMFQSNPKFNPSLNDQNFKMGTFEEFGLSSQAPAGNMNNNNGNHHAPVSWVAGGGELNQQCVNLRSGHGNMNGKFIRYATGTANSSGFFGNKTVEDLRVREGMVEPWICSSD